MEPDRPTPDSTDEPAGSEPSVPDLIPDPLRLDATLASGSGNGPAEPNERPASPFVAMDTVIVRVRDLATSRAWYEERLGLEVSFEGPGVVVFDVGSVGRTTLTLYELSPGEAEPPPGRCFPVLRVDDVQAARDALAARGVEVEPVRTDGTAKWFGFRDAEGCRLEACQIVSAGWA